MVIHTTASKVNDIEQHLMNILIVYPDKKTAGLPESKMLRHYWQHLVLYFDNLQPQAHEHLFFFKTGHRFWQNKEQRQFERKLHQKIKTDQIDLVVSFPFSSNLEKVAEKFSLSYCAFEYFGLNSKYIDCFHLSNNAIANIGLKNVSPTAGPQHHFLSRVNEAVFACQFLPLPDQYAKAFYHTAKSVWLFIVDDLMDEDLAFPDKACLRRLVETPIQRFLAAYPAAGTHIVDIMMYGDTPSLVNRVASIVRDLDVICLGQIHIVKRRFSTNENLVYSYIKKADMIFSVGSCAGIGIDARIMNKPVVFIGNQNPFLNKLNGFSAASRITKTGGNPVGNQKKILDIFFSHLYTTGRLLPNRAYSASALYKRLNALSFDSNRQTVSADGKEITCAIKNSSDTGSILPPYRNVSRHIENKWIKINDKMEIIVRKITKLQKDPKAFCHDSRFPGLRFFGKILS